MKAFITLVLLLALVVPTSAFAQDETRLPECDLEDVRVIVEVINEHQFLLDYADIVAMTNDMDITTGILIDIVESVSDLQERWWTEMVVDFPSCVFANNFGRDGGHMLDELLISAAIGQVALAEIQKTDRRAGNRLLERFEYHIGEWTTLQEKILQQMSFMTQILEEEDAKADD